MFSCGNRAHRHPERLSKVSQRDKFLDLYPKIYDDFINVRLNEENPGTMYVYTQDLMKWRENRRRKQSLKRIEFLKHNFYKYKHKEATQRHKEILLSGNGLFQPHPEYTIENLRKKRQVIEKAKSAASFTNPND